ncbi:bifunctional ADP-dependent NAD(P)H-hydrate dehydratase/NAD(P)H-hydrate epimerase [Aurantimonas sp. Leaf443]|uniref:bifunctional ADP-dependent NAD(P)H-hydrate dehydratase/NAD(P)H-hydrate epimerase n=1 Tax=Aurantimonas sp. Leaf443 TaxID=1736378 RepID=UPI0006F8F21A|nr:bifunctional ADP-dependent NAD(P)H-hydrate dehydratase/NAD(P)H-hydrate epimerase [Aurantimonas sp. Leaf443]KQT83511.1 NAD(P)H-hydrate epimerase [Aurantimonas sp. Leaf443]
MKRRQTFDPNAVALLTPDEMARADALTIAAGTAGIALMENAGAAVAMAAEALAAAGPVAVLAGPGNNGGDAYVAARRLAEAGREVALFTLGRPREGSDAALAAGSWTGGVRSLPEFRPDGFALVVDGLFGAGLARPPEGAARAAIERLNASAVAVLAIDLPSGLHGGSGQALGVAVEADATVTFFRAKPGHLLQPGRDHCGTLQIAEIGIGAAVLDEIAPQTFRNEPRLFAQALRRPQAAGHKYDRGHAVVFGGPTARTGAARLSALAALRGGAGLVSVFAPGSAVLAYAAHLTAIMLKRCNDVAELAGHLTDERFNAFVLGPGFGAGEPARAYAAAVMAAGRALVLDADGITAFAGEPTALFAARGDAPLVLTPHEGEFKRLFPDLSVARSMAKTDRAREAARRAGAVVVLKGADTVIAAPDGRAAINATGTPWLATAGTGDVLSGLVAAALAQRTPPFEAACAAVWMHGRAAERFGPGLIAEDLPGLMPQVHAELG